MLPKGRFAHHCRVLPPMRMDLQYSFFDLVDDDRAIGTADDHEDGATATAAATADKNGFTV